MDETRTALLHSEEIDQRIKAMRTIMDEIKQPQFIGSDSVRFYKKDSGLTSDWSGVPPQSPQAAYVSTKVLRVTATALTQNVLFADLIAELRINSAGAARHTVIDYINEIYTGSDYWSIDQYDDAQEPGAENVRSWTVVISGGDYDGIARPMNTVFMKCYVVANDDVQINVVSLN